MQRLAIKIGCRRLSLAAGGQAHHHPQVKSDGLEGTCGQPVLGLLVDRVPGRQVVRHHSPGNTAAHQAAKGIEHFVDCTDAGWRPRSTGSDKERRTPIPRRSRRSGRVCVLFPCHDFTRDSL